MRLKIIFIVTLTYFSWVSTAQESFQVLAQGYPTACFFKGDSTQKWVALTFDDGPTTVSEKVMAILNKHSAKASFFWLGQNLEEYANLVRRAVSDGHTIGSHSWDHPNGFMMAFEDLWSSQVAKTNLEFEKVGLPKPRFYRPPFGAIRGDQVQALAQKEMTIVLWSISTMDWDPTQNTATEIADKFKTGLHPGAIVLLHDRGFQDQGQHMLLALEEILVYGISQGYQFVTLDELLK